jgi:hypothetical protein
MRMTVAVTRRDIDRAERRTCRACPVALAINRMLLPHLFAFVAVRSWIVTLDDKGHEVWEGAIPLALPRAVTDWLRDYDDGRDVPTLSFVIDIPDACLLRAA